MYVDNVKVKRRLSKDVALARCQAPGKLTGGRCSSFPEGNGNSIVWGNLSRKFGAKACYFCFTCWGERAEQVIRTACCLFQSHVRFGWGCHSHVLQTIFTAYFGSEKPNSFCRLHCNIGGNSTELLKLNHHLQLMWASGFSFEFCCYSYLVSWAVLSMWNSLSVLNFPIHKSGSGTHCFTKVFWDPQKKST